MFNFFKHPHVWISDKTNQKLSNLRKFNWILKTKIWEFLDEIGETMEDYRVLCAKSEKIDNNQLKAFKASILIVLSGLHN